MRAMALSAVLLAAFGCARAPQSYPIPEQHSVPAGEDKLAVYEYVKAGDPDAEERFMRHITGLQPSGWRWTNERPELRLRLGKTSARKLMWDFAIAGATIKDTGPITIEFTVNGRVLDRVSYPKDGEFKFQKQVPDDWLTAYSETLIAAEIKPPWPAPDGSKLGIIFKEAGFLP